MQDIESLKLFAEMLRGYSIEVNPSDRKAIAAIRDISILVLRFISPGYQEQIQ